MPLKYKKGDRIRLDIYHTTNARKRKKPTLSYYGIVTKVTKVYAYVTWEDNGKGIITWCESPDVTVLV